ncbi:hypothetical protein M3G15_07560 [Paenibacillus sp. p3-SID1389]|uniref:hypothetical protein n=1 Tax=Paenibacillus sp. p3-SID1389 TaxID=2916364 RepID=UPI0021A67AE1|nr:hypothetical protein [Paenibacillus sp. p3-SID1389]MCT2194993.1 hypothetical protein [Paenibacillus sp. p3-SID1389]
MVKSLQSGLILSTLLLWTSQQVGTTFGEFTSTREDNTEIKACRVFPSQIESQLAMLAEHLNRAASLKGRLIGASLIRASIDTTTPISSPALPNASDPATSLPLPPSSTDAVYSSGDGPVSSEGSADFSASLQLDAAEGLSARISELNATIQQLQQQLALNQSTWQELVQEITAATAVIQGLLTSLNGLEPNCAELTQTTVLDRIADLLKGSGLLSGPLRGTLQEILSYLRSVHQSKFSLSTNGFVAIAFASPFSSRSADDLSALSDPVAGEERTYFESVHASLESAIAGLTAEISSLEAQRAQLLAEAEAQRLAELERLKQLEEEPPPTVGDSGDGAVQPPAEEDGVAEDESATLPPDAPASSGTPGLEPLLPPEQPNPLDSLILTKPEDELPIDLNDDGDEEDDDDENEDAIPSEVGE